MSDNMRRLLKKLFPSQMRWQSSRRHFWGQFWLTGEHELRELRAYVDPCKGAVDIGGNTGVYAYHLSRYAKWVRVFEPNPDYAARLTALRLPNIAVECVALSDHVGEAELRVPSVAGRDDFGMASLETRAVGDASLSRILPVKLTTLDSYALDGLGFIKLDVEGHEELVLAGAMDTIRANRPALLIEVEERHNPGGLGRITSLLKELTYRGYYFQGGERLEVETFNAARNQVVNDTLDQASHNRRAIPYINNFLFLPAEAAS